jgi:hypothetical protein
MQKDTGSRTFIYHGSIHQWTCDDPVLTHLHSLAPRNSRRRLHSVVMLAAAVTPAAQAIPTAQAQAAADPAQRAAYDQFNLLVGDQYAYDDNLYRVPAQYNIASLGPNFARQDRINTLIAGFAGEWTFLRQDIQVSARLNNNRFARNDLLNNTGGTGKLLLDWLLTSRLSGTAGVDFSRSLAGFADTFFFAKDLVDTTSYFATARTRLAQNWNLNVGATESDTQHSASERAADEVRTRYGNLGIEYVTANGGSLAFEYQYTAATYPFPSVLNGVPFDRNYKDHLGQLTVDYLFGGATQLKANAGYLKRRYELTDVGSFSGDTWRISLARQLTGKTQISVAAWRELAAFLDASADYFVSRGESLSATWEPTAKLTLSLSGSYAGQNYISSSTSVIIFNQRHDIVRSAQASLEYVPRDPLHLTLSYRFENRDSTAALLAYDDRTVAVQLTYQFL